MHEILRLKLLDLLQHTRVRRGHCLNALRNRRAASDLPHAHGVEVSENVLERQAELELSGELVELRLDRSLHRKILVDDRGELYGESPRFRTHRLHACLLRVQRALLRAHLRKRLFERKARRGDLVHDDLDAGVALREMLGEGEHIESNLKFVRRIRTKCVTVVLKHRDRRHR